MERFQVRTQVVSGTDSLSCLGEMDCQRLLIVADPFFVAQGWTNRILEAAKPRESRVFDKVSPDPTVELAAEGTKVLQEFAPDTVVALGGGSTLDLAKAMVHFSGLEPRLVAIPTTSGSGSEVTNFAVLSHQGVKYPVVSDKLYPAVAVLEPGLLETLPKGLIADTGFDVLTHALESYVAKNAGTVTKTLSREAFAIAYAQLPLSYAGDKSVRERLHIAACMAGMAFSQAGLGLCHAMAHVLGGEFHLPHGRLCGILLPAVVECNANFCSGAYGQLARSVGFFGSADTVAVRNLKNGLIRLRKQLGMPGSLREAGIDPRQIQLRQKELTEKILADPCCESNPAEVMDYMVKRILEGVAR
ncbi:MAG: iron-containing alcohol dehydrogenase [Oscillospiraceae bacterium]|nr:iron-containing alcohol dehydrogenase [Oscillospiraceae bacterium]